MRNFHYLQHSIYKVDSNIFLFLVSLIFNRPSEDIRPTIQLIDFGCVIDMTLFLEGTYKIYTDHQNRRLRNADRKAVDLPN